MIGRGFKFGIDFGVQFGIKLVVIHPITVWG
jgi:hypothetical protein